ncbi:MAG: hypothetical protein RLZZ546_2388, partial [Bacteroidota bacterium]
MIKKNIFLFLALLLIFSCNENSSIGEGLLSDERLDLDYTNNFIIKGATYINKPSISYFRNVDQFGQLRIATPSTALIGNLDDPYFGKLKSAFYASIVYNGAQSIPSFTDYVLDSAVMSFT